MLNSRLFPSDMLHSRLFPSNMLNSRLFPSDMLHFYFVFPLICFISRPEPALPSILVCLFCAIRAIPAASAKASLWSSKLGSQFYLLFLFQLNDGPIPVKIRWFRYEPSKPGEMNRLIQVLSVSRGML